MRNKRLEKQMEATELLQLKVTAGSVLINQTNGYVYNNSIGKQVKINIGKARRGRDYKFSRPYYWREATKLESFLIKSGLYRIFKVKFKK